MNKTPAVFAATLALLCGACSGGGTLPPGTTAGPNTAAASQAAGRIRRVNVRFAFKIPRHVHRHEARYVSPGTASIQVTVFNANHSSRLAQAGVNTTPGSGGCTAVLNGTFGCSLAMAVPPGSDTFDVASYDALNESGHQLSATSNFAFHIVAGKPNNVAMTLGGIPASIDVALVGSSIFAAGNASSGFQFGGIGRGAMQQLQLTAKDADGYTIVNPGMPALSLSSGAASKLSVAAVAGSAGLFDLTPLAETNALPVPAPGTAISLTATATPIGTGTVPLSVNVSVQNDAVTFAGNQTAGVQVNAPWSATPILSLPYSIAPNNAAIVIDSSGNVYVCNSVAGTINVYPPGSATASRTITGLSVPCQPSSMAVDASGDIFVPEEFPAYDVKEFTPGGGNTPSRTMPNSYPAVALDATGNLYVANYSGANTGVSVFAPGASTTPAFAFKAGMSGPFVPAFDQIGNLYVTNDTSDIVTEYKPPFSSTSTVAHTFGDNSKISDPQGLAIDGSGNVYVASDDCCFAVTEYTPGSPTTAVRTLSAGTGVVGVALDPLGNVYVPAYGLQSVNVYPAGLSTTALESWTTGTDYPIAIAVWP